LEATHPCTSPIRQHATASVRDFQPPDGRQHMMAVLIVTRTYSWTQATTDAQTDTPVATGDPAAQDCSSLARLIHHDRSGW